MDRPTVARPSVDQIVGTDPRERELRLLDREEIADGLRQRPIPVLRRGLQPPQFLVGLDEREAAVEVDLERLGGDVARGTNASTRASTLTGRAATRVCPVSSATASSSIST